MKNNRSVGLLCILLLCAIPAYAADSPQLLAETASGRVPLESESSIEIRGFHVHVQVRIGKTQELLFGAITEGDRKTERSVRLSSDGSIFYLQPAPGDEVVPHDLQVVVPAELAVSLFLEDAVVDVSTVGGEVFLKGKDLDITARNLKDRLVADIDSSKMNLNGIGSDVEIDGSDLILRGGRIEGDLGLDLTRSDIELEQISGSLRANLTESELVVATVRGLVDLEADGGGVDAAELTLGGLFRMERAYLRISGSRGDLTIESDDELTLEDNEAAAHVDSFGGSVRVLNQKGLIEIKTDGTTTVLEQIDAPLRVQGDDLRLDLKNLSSETILILSHSTVTAEGVSGPLEIHNDYGELTLSNTSKHVAIKMVEGDVTVLQASGSLDIETDGEMLEVGWSSISRDRETTLVNKGGDVILHLPKQGGGMLSARSDYGRIECDRDDIVVSPDGDSARGLVNRQRSPNIKIEAKGDIRILDATSQ